jgi:hypothetical protein
VRALALDRRRAEEFQRFREKEIGRAGLLLARPLAVERPAERRLSIRPALFRHTDRPFCDERRLTLTAERNERHDSGTLRLARGSLGPGVLDELRLPVPPNERGRRVPVDAGDVERRGECRLHFALRQGLRRRSDHRRRKIRSSANGRLFDSRPTVQFAKKPLITWVAPIEGFDPIEGVTLERVGYRRFGFVPEQHRDESSVPLIIVDIL